MIEYRYCCLGGQPRLDEYSSLGGRNGMPMDWIYVLKSLNAEKSYVGITDNIHRRLNQHNAGKHSYTKRYLPWKVVYYEQVDSRIEARAREKYFKSSAGRKWMRYNIFGK